LITAIILAGGQGTRLRSAVSNLPKPMAPVEGKPFIEYQLDYWISQGVGQFVISVGYLKEVIMDHFGTSYRSIPLKYAVEDEPLGTGGALLLAIQGLTEQVLVLNGDTFFSVDLAELIKFHKERSSDWTFSLFRSTEVGRYMGIDVKSDGAIRSLQCSTGKMGYLANGGVYLVNPNVLVNEVIVPRSKLSLEEDLIPALTSRNCKLFGLEFFRPFIDIGTPEDYYRAAEVLPS
jgi:D-glycero-alpha-D-manno-heptose 1-phosphate guanylyltransferase